MIYKSGETRRKAENKFGEYYKATQHNSIRNKRATANICDGISYENLKQNPTSTFDTVFSYYDDIDDNTYYKTIIYFCSEYPDAVISGNEHLLFLNDLKDESNTEPAGGFNRWSLLALRELVDEVPNEFTDDISTFLTYLEQRSGSDIQHEMEIWALLGILYKLSVLEPTSLVREKERTVGGKGIVDIIVDTAVDSSVALNRSLAVAILVELIDFLPDRGKNSIVKYEDRLSKLLYDDSKSVQYHTCRLVERSDAFRNEKQQINSLYSRSKALAFGDVDEDPPINGRLYLAAGRAHVRVNGDKDTAKQARKFVDQGTIQSIFETEIKNAVQQLQHPQPVVAEHASFVVVGQSRDANRLVEHFTEIARSIQGGTNIVAKVNLATAILNVCHSCAGVTSIETDFMPTKEQWEYVINAIRVLWERHPKATQRSIDLLESIAHLRPDIVENHIGTNELPTLPEIMNKSKINPSVAGSISATLYRFVGKNIEKEEIFRNSNIFPEIARNLYSQSSGVSLYAHRLCTVIRVAMSESELSDQTVQELVSPVSKFVLSDESSGENRGKAIKILSMFAMISLDGREILPTIYNGIKEYRTETEPTLVGVWYIAKVGFDIPPHVRNWVASCLDGSKEVSNDLAKTTGGIAVRVLAEIGDEKAYQTIDEITENENYPIETRQTAQQILLDEGKRSPPDIG
jgi:hypothetical protein